MLKIRCIVAVVSASRFSGVTANFLSFLNRVPTISLKVNSLIFPENFQFKFDILHYSNFENTTYMKTLNENIAPWRCQEKLLAIFSTYYLSPKHKHI